MALSKEIAEAEILERTKLRSDNELSRIDIRHLDSVHPIDCLCPVCSPFNNKGMSYLEEKERREDLDYPES